MDKVVITAFYHFFDFQNYQEAQKPLLDFCNKKQLKGTILIAKEGINSTISGAREAINDLYHYLTGELLIKDLSYKESAADFQPFEKMKVRLKKEIVALGVENLPIIDNTGTYIEPKDWDEFISQEDVITIDTRNSYEVKLGSFDGAINPKTQNFRELPQWVQDHLMESKSKKIAMFCTGGIRCEKSTAYLKNLGFDEVYHLKGGILQYLEDTKNVNHKWHGSCFIFDNRVNLDDNLAPKMDVLCRYCRTKISTDDLKACGDECAADICHKCHDAA